MSKISNTQLYNDALKKQALNPIGLNKAISITHSAEGYNASCGDEITIHLELIDDNTRIKDVAFETESCAICRASASLLCQSVGDLSKEKVTSITKQLQNILKDTSTDNQIELAKLDLELLSPISQFPSRVNCALLPWETLVDVFNDK